MSYDEYTPRAFICSTQKDLMDEREIASRLCVFKDVLPQSMEQFSSSDQTQWDFIELILKKCDFVIILLGGRYGSINLSDDKKRSYTECEYLFAVQERIPILRFVQDMSDGAILVANDDADDKAEAAKRMKAFRALVVKDRMTAKWANRDDFIT